MKNKVSEIRRNLENKSTKELREILISQNSEEWTQEAFLAVEEILRDRNELAGDYITCSNCGSANITYDNYWKENTCEDCGYSEKDLRELNYHQSVSESDSLQDEDTPGKAISTTQIRMRGLINGVVFTLICSIVFFLIKFWDLAPFLSKLLGADIAELIVKGFLFIWAMGAITCFLGGIAQLIIGKPILFKGNLSETIDKILT